MRICAVSDMHGNLNFKVPECDLLLIAGDLCPATHNSYTSINMQHDWLYRDFTQWLKDQPAKHVLFIAGNHDWIWEVARDRVPWICNDRIEYLENDFRHYDDLKIYGTPVSPMFLNWAFNREEESLVRHWEAIPEDTDILLCHCPPYGIMDKTNHPDYPSKHIGSKSLKERIDIIRPELVVFGHNHGDHGMIEKDGIVYVNASLLDEKYKMIREPIVIEVEEL